MSDVAAGRVMVLKVEDAERVQGLRLPPVGIVEEKETNRVIHDLTFEGPRSGADGEPIMLVNSNTD